MPQLAGTNPTTDINTILSSYFVFSTNAAGDKFRLLGVHQGVLRIPELSTLY